MDTEEEGGGRGRKEGGREGMVMVEVVFEDLPFSVSFNSDAPIGRQSIEAFSLIRVAV